jgi:uncharacterized protein
LANGPHFINLGIVEDSKARVWKKIALFYTLTMCFSGVFDAFVLHAGKMDAGNLLYVTGSMWSPALAAFATKAIFGERIRDLPWKWGPVRYPWLAYLIPLAYTLPVYLVVWLGGLGEFADADFVKRTAEQFGWSNFPPGLTLTLFVLLTATLGLVGKTSRALGEEIGWRGFLVPELAKVPAWYGLTCFTVMVVADSFILAWLTLRSGSLWPAAILHGSHNLFIQSIFTPLTRDTGPTKYIIDEFGIGLVVTITIAAIVVCRRPRTSSPATSR